MNAVISVVGKDAVGIIAKTSTACAEYQANIIDISQTVQDEYFTMIMIVNIDSLTLPFTEFIDKFELLGKASNVTIHVMHADIFNAMHKI